MEIYALALIIGYVFGALPFAVVIGRLYGVDVLKEGSGNPGATNVRRLAGSFAGRLVFVLDALKGGLATAWPLFPCFQWTADASLMALCGLGGAILGHSFSIFIKFKGGKGVSTTIGGLVVLMPWVVAIGLIFWGLVFLMFRYVSLASIVFALSLPISAYALQLGPVKCMLALVLAFFVIIRHRSNIVRLIQGRELPSQRSKK